MIVSGFTDQVAYVCYFVIVSILFSVLQNELHYTVQSNSPAVKLLPLNNETPIVFYVCNLNTVLCTLM